MDSPRPPEFCSRCYSLPEKIEGSGSLYLWFPLGHSLAKVVQSLRQTTTSYRIDNEEQHLVIDLEAEQVKACMSRLADTLSDHELQSTKALFMPLNQKPRLRDFANAKSLSGIISLSKSDWLLDILAAERVTSQFQPIVYTEEPTRIFGQEALLRGVAADSSLIPPGQFFALAAETDMLFWLDLLARRSAIRQAKLHQIETKIFINFTPTSIYDPAYCLRSTIRAIDEAGINHGQIVFEVVESDKITDITHLKNILDTYRKAGFLVALDDFGAGYSNLNLLHQLRPDLIKLDRELIRNVPSDPYKALVTKKILEIATQLGIKTVAEGVETLPELNWVREHGATFVQGYYIAKPSTIPTTSLPLAVESLAS